MTTALVPYVDWFGFCPECRHFGEIDTETTVVFESVVCVVCAPHLWEGYVHACANLPGPDPWDAYKKALGV